jgi:predicted RNA-binding Zn ribbon-like protein
LILASDTTKPPQRRIFELIAGHPALDLVNTLDWRFRAEGAEEFLESYQDLLDFGEQSGLLNSQQTRRLLRSTAPDVAARELARVRNLREAVETVLYAALDQSDPTPASVRLLESSFRLAHKHQHLLWTPSGMVWELPHDDAAPELPLLLLSLSTEALLTSDDISKLRACGNLECRWLFLDTSKNHTRRWCDMKICGNRMKARRFKAQHRT